MAFNPVPDSSVQISVGKTVVVKNIEIINQVANNSIGK